MKRFYYGTQGPIEYDETQSLREPSGQNYFAGAPVRAFTSDGDGRLNDLFLRGVSVGVALVVGNNHKLEGVSGYSGDVTVDGTTLTFDKGILTGVS